MLKKIVLSFLLFILATIFIAPQIVGSFFGSWAINRYVEAHGGKFHAKNISLAWLGPQTLEEFSLSLNDGSNIKGELLTVNAPLLAALTNKIPLVEVRAVNLSGEFLQGTLQLHKMNFNVTPEENAFRANLSGTTVANNQQGQFLVEALINPEEKKILEASATIDNLPLALIDKLRGGSAQVSSPWATAILGATANLTVQKTPSAILAHIDTTSLKGKFSLVSSPEGWEFHNVTPVEFKVSPELFHLLKQDLSAEAIKKLEVIDQYTFSRVEFALNEREEQISGLVEGDLEGFPVSARLLGGTKLLDQFSLTQEDQITLDLQIPPGPFNHFREALYGTGSGQYLLLQEPTKIHFALEKLNPREKEVVISVDVEPLLAKNSITGENIPFPHMSGRLNMIGGVEYSLQMHAGNSDLLAVSRGKGNLKVRATLNKFVYGIFSDLITGDPLIREKAEATMGNDLNGEITLSLANGDGYVNGALSGTQGSVELSALFSNGTITLRTPFVIKSTMTPLLAQRILGPLLPFLSNAFQSDQMIVLTIEPENFYAPIQGANLQNVNVAGGSLQLGRVQFKNHGSIESMLSILKPAATGELSAWFTPAYFSIRQGHLNLQRLDMLVMQAYHLAIWGNLNFNDQTVDMKLALGGTALNRAFSMPSPLGDDDMIAFPLRGPFSNPSVDKARALTQITGLITKLQGTPQGFIIGSFIQAAGKIGEEPIPPPTTSPFPWEGQIQPQKGGGASSSPAAKIEKPLKKVFKVVGFGF